jgi:ParB/RepB/Spo0J family partition protein
MYKEIEIDNIRTNYIKNCRRTVNIDDLKESIEATGLQMPIGVVELDAGSYGLIYGFRRYTAIKELGYASISCRVLESQSESDLLLLNLQENVTRKNLTVMEEARAIRTIVDKGGDIETFRKKLGWSKTIITQRLAIFNMPENIQDSLEEDKITITQARALSEAPEEILERLLDEAEKGFTAKHIREQVDLHFSLEEEGLLDLEDDIEDISDEDVTSFIDNDQVDLDLYSNIIKSTLLDIGSKSIEDQNSLSKFIISIKSIDFGNLKEAELSSLLNAMGSLEENMNTFGWYEKRQNEFK